jgi:hypothetical protein
LSARRQKGRNKPLERHSWGDSEYHLRWSLWLLYTI